MKVAKGRRGMLNTCPHCQARAVVYTSRKVSDLVVERYMQCTDVDCGHQYVIQMGVLRSLMPSAKPNPAIHIPMVERRTNDIIVARAAGVSVLDHQHAAPSMPLPSHSQGSAPAPLLN